MSFLLKTSGLIARALQLRLLQCSVSLSPNINSLLSPSLSHVPQTRTYWRDDLRYTMKSDPDSPRGLRITYENIDYTMERRARAQKAEGRLGRKEFYQGNKPRYEKPWQKKKRLRNERLYKSKETKVNELKTYIKFLQEHGRPIGPKDH
uniref:Uncharacterized protein n=1 Tax=Trieres chinensis TaxID=1514140 RepID=A0A7S2EV25_TRICV|mmetsp:Transcript_39672/g.80962  ORF Transcript_39672/g.80962 Transcript_39672/m.80962 type:complete len:149 (+) Transcript_39672:142-588(+)